MKTRITELLGIEHPIVQAGMSWASSNAALALAVSEAGGLGVIAAGPMYPEALRQAIGAVKAGTKKPWALNVPLYSKRAAEFLDIALEEGVPILVASQGGPKQHLARFRAAGVKWIHVTASPLHAKKAEDAGADAVVAVGGEAGGHPAPDEVSSLVLVRATVKAVKIPVIAGGGVADGWGIAALLALGAEAVQLGTRFIATPEAGVHDAYKSRVLAAGISDTTLVGRGRLPIRVLKNRFTEAFDAAAAGTAQAGEIDASSSLRRAALEGDVDWGKVEAGQSAGLVEDLVPAGELLRRLVAEAEAARARLAAL